MKASTTAIVFAVAVLPALSMVAAEPLAPSIRIVSYNVKKGTPAKTIAADLLPLKADIVALQEVDSGTRRSQGEDQLRLLRELLGMNGHYAPSYRVDGGTTGMMVLSRWRLLETGSIALPNSRDVGAVATVDADGRSMRVYSVHLSATYRVSVDHAAEAAKARGREAGRIAELASASKTPVIVAGDLNASQGSEPHRALASKLVDCALALREPSPTFPRSLPALRLDHVFVTKQLRPIRVETKQGVSDHLMVIVDFVWQEQVR